MMDTARYFVYRFFDLPHVTRTRIALDMGLCDESELSQPDEKLFGQVFRNAIQRNVVTALMDRTSEEWRSGRSR